MEKAETSSLNGKSPRVGVLHHRWAAEQFGFDPQLPPDELESAALVRLEDADFVLSDEAHLGLRLLHQGDHPHWSEDDLTLLSEIERQHCRQQLIEFYEKFFDLPVRQRVEEYERLGALCENFPCLLQLHRRLGPGLHLDQQILNGESAELRHLGAVILLMFAAWPGMAGPIFRRHVSPLFAEAKKWRRVAVLCNERHPSLAALGAGWMNRLLTGRRHELRAKKSSTSRVSRPWWKQAPNLESPQNRRPDFPLPITVLSIALGVLLAIVVPHKSRQSHENESPSLRVVPFKSYRFQINNEALLRALGEMPLDSQLQESGQDTPTSSPALGTEQEIEVRKAAEATTRILLGLPIRPEENASPSASSELPEKEQ